MGRKGPGAKTKTVLKSVSKMQQLGSMPDLKFQTFLNKNPPSAELTVLLHLIPNRMKYLILQSADTQNCGLVYILFSIFLFSIFVLAVLEILLVVIPKNVPGEVKDCARDHLTKINYPVV